MSEQQEVNTGFKDLLNATMSRRWAITLTVLITFMLLALGILLSIRTEAAVSGEWKELLLLMLGALIGYYFNQALLGFLAAGTLLNIWYLYKVIDIAGIIERSNLSLTKDTIWNQIW